MSKFMFSFLILTKHKLMQENKEVVIAQQGALNGKEQCNPGKLNLDGLTGRMTEQLDGIFFCRVLKIGDLT